LPIIKYIFLAVLSVVGLSFAAPKLISLVQEKAMTGPYVAIAGTNVPVELAQTKAERESGLSGRASLDPGSGMLFIFPRADKYSFWMPDMHFPLDMIWIDNGAVVDITKNVTNVFDANNPVFYRPAAPAQYVLEVNAGFSDTHGIKKGSGAIFKNIGENGNP
jgi:uncharacterized membrane protein (UPF0127 family)